MPCPPLPVPITAVPRAATSLALTPPICGLDECRRPVDLIGTRSRWLDEEENPMPIDDPGPSCGPIGRPAGAVTPQRIDRHG